MDLVSELIHNAQYALRSDIQYMRELGKLMLLAAAEILDRNVP